METINKKISSLNPRTVFKWGFVSGTLLGHVLMADCAKVAVLIGEAKTNQDKSIQRGSQLMRGAKIKTEIDSFVKLILKDESIVDIGPSSVFLINSCETNHQHTNLNLELELGTIRANIVKTKTGTTRELKLKTPTSLLGVRGTEFFVSWEKDSSGLVQEQIGVSHGEIQVTSLFDQRPEPISLPQGTEFRGEGKVEKSEGGLKVEQSNSRVDQFTAKEQKTFENNTKIEQKAFEERVELKPNSKEGSEKTVRVEQIKVQEKMEKFVLAATENRSEKKGSEFVFRTDEPKKTEPVNRTPAQTNTSPPTSSEKIEKSERPESMEGVAKVEKNEGTPAAAPTAVPTAVPAAGPTPGSQGTLPSSGIGTGPNLGFAPPPVFVELKAIWSVSK